MEGSPDPEPQADPPRPSVVTRLGGAALRWLRARPRNVGYAVVLAALLLTVPFGGLAAVPEEDAPRSEPGEAVAAAPWEITWERAIQGPELGGAFLAQEGLTHVLLLGELRTTFTETVPVGDLRTSIVLHTPGLRDDTGTEVEVGASPSFLHLYAVEPTPQPLTALSPGLSYRVGLHLTTAGPPPEQVEVELLAKTRRQSSLEDVQVWADPTSVGRVAVPVEASPPVFESIWSLLP